MNATEQIEAQQLNELHIRYKIKEEAIGAGVFGSVYSAIDKVTNEHVAIKILHEFPQDTYDSKQLLREIRLLHMLQGHHNIIALKHIVASHDNDNIQAIALVFQHYPQNLDQVIRSHRLLSSKEIKYILYQILCGINYIHSAQLVHRDLKPANILIDEHNRTVICDFGLSRATQRINTADHLSADAPPTLYRKLTQYVVTRWYRSPELILGNSNAGEAPADMWSVGCILAELQLSRPLFDQSKNSNDILSLIMHIIGTPQPDEDLEWIESNSAYHEVKHFPSKQSRIKRLFHNILDSSVDLIEQLLQFNPKKRLIAEKALQHSFFSSYANESISTFSTETMSVAEKRALADYYKLEVESINAEDNRLTQRIHELIKNEMTRYTPESFIAAPAITANPISDTSSKNQEQLTYACSAIPLPEEYETLCSNETQSEASTLRPKNLPPRSTTPMSAAGFSLTKMFTSCFFAPQTKPAKNSTNLDLTQTLISPSASPHLQG